MKKKTVKRKVLAPKKTKAVRRGTLKRKAKSVGLKKKATRPKALKLRKKGNRKRIYAKRRAVPVRASAEEQLHEGNTRLIVYIPFNNLNVRETLPASISALTLPEANTQFTEAWINKRVEIFMNFTLKSLLNQTNPHYLAYIVYHDTSRFFIENALLGYPALPSNIRFISSSEYEAEVIRQLEGYKYWYELHLYSDDMYHKAYIDMLYNYRPRPGTKVLICQNGYIYNSVSNILAKYFNFSSSFNCLIYKVSDYINGVRHNIFQPSETGVWTGAIQLEHEIMPYPVYINHGHDANTAFFFAQEVQNNAAQDVWTNNAGHYSLFGDIIYDPYMKQRILEDFLGASAPVASPPYMTV
ncbi:hypothetical protein FHS16_005059 [Paenibacillus endophyticus]|uniref:Uncharacterized protein n=1 Tax=Paenibacillus endophyticus TaxID=1294268 RepID=A0A7W5GCL6_9BACL|nr:hypothetical protein [Paenibacillus endophyticus]MBB3154960.1 hypothetical protein [Paenibacillus endophyticus]